MYKDCNLKVLHPSLQKFSKGMSPTPFPMRKKSEGRKFKRGFQNKNRLPPKWHRQMSRGHVLTHIKISHPGNQGILPWPELESTIRHSLLWLYFGPSFSKWRFMRQSLYGIQTEDSKRITLCTCLQGDPGLMVRISTQRTHENTKRQEQGIIKTEIKANIHPWEDITSLPRC